MSRGEYSTDIQTLRKLSVHACEQYGSWATCCVSRWQRNVCSQPPASCPCQNASPGLYDEMWAQAGPRMIVKGSGREPPPSYWPDSVVGPYVLRIPQEQTLREALVLGVAWRYASIGDSRCSCYWFARFGTLRVAGWPWGGDAPGLPADPDVRRLAHPVPLMMDSPCSRTPHGICCEFMR
jgi:hypothetical protein